MNERDKQRLTKLFMAYHKAAQQGDSAEEKRLRKLIDKAQAIVWKEAGYA